MKTYFTIIAAISLGLIVSCQPEEVKPVGEPFSKMEQIQGTWTVSQVILIDVDAAQKGHPLFAQQLDITNALPNNPFTDISIEFLSDLTFTINHGSAFSKWPTSGTWELNNPVYPSGLLLKTETDTLQLSFSSLSNIVMSPATLKVREVKQHQQEDILIDVLFYDYLLVKE